MSLSALSRKIVLLTAVATMFGLSVTAAQSQTKISRRVAYTGVITWLPAMIAKEDGLFDKNGLDVTMTRFTQIANLPPTLGKQFDLVPHHGARSLNAVASGLNIAAVAGETLPKRRATNRTRCWCAPTRGYQYAEGFGR